MKLSIQEKNLTITREFRDNCSPEEVLLGSLDLIGRIFSSKSAVEAYYNIDPDSMDLK
jgi:hypothetical protein